MCVAIHKPLGCTISRKDLNDAWETNPHGGGFAFRTALDGEIVIMKGIMSKKRWIKAILAIQEDVEMLIHARIATHGLKDDKNTHPFELPGGGAWIHNGVVPGYPYGQDRSDTAMFTNEFLIPLLTDYPDFLTRAYGQKMVAELLSVSKGMFMLPGQPVLLLNTKTMTTENGICFSNTHFRPKPCTPTKGVYDSKDWVWDPTTNRYSYKPPAQPHTVLPLGGRAAQYDDDPEWLEQWGDETLDEGESTGDEYDVDTPALTPAMKQAFKELDEADQKQLEEDRKAFTRREFDKAVVPWKPLAQPAVWVNGKSMPYDEYLKLQVRVKMKTEAGDV